MTLTRAQRRKLETETTNLEAPETKKADKKVNKDTVKKEKKPIIDNQDRQSILENEKENEQNEQVDKNQIAQVDNEQSNIEQQVDNEQTDNEKVDNEQTNNEQTNNEQVDSESESESDSGSDSGSDSSSDSESESEEDLDDLLNKAEKALTSNQNELALEKPACLPKLSKMNSSTPHALYFETIQGQAKLSSDAVQLAEDQETTKKDAALVLKANNTLAQKPSRRERQEERAKTTGGDWFDMPRPEITPEIKRDLQVLKMRHVLDRKRHYKKMGKKEDPKYFQVGRIIQGPTEFFSARMTKKERKETIVDELLASEEQKQYYKRKHEQVSANAKSGGKRDFKKLKAQRKMKY